MVRCRFALSLASALTLSAPLLSFAQAPDATTPGGDNGAERSTSRPLLRIRAAVGGAYDSLKIGTTENRTDWTPDDGIPQVSHDSERHSGFGTDLTVAATHPLASGVALGGFARLGIAPSMELGHVSDAGAYHPDNISSKYLLAGPMLGFSPRAIDGLRVELAPGIGWMRSSNWSSLTEFAFGGDAAIAYEYSTGSRTSLGAGVQLTMIWRRATEAGDGADFTYWSTLISPSLFVRLGYDLLGS